MYKNDKPSEHLSWGELACKDGTPYPEEFEDRALRLGELFEDIRLLTGRHPIIVNSAYRTPEYNKRIGGVPNSQHIQGRAIDLKHTTMPNEKFYYLLSGSAQALGIGGIGHYKTFVHVDIRPGNHIARWHGAGVNNDDKGTGQD